MRPNTHTPWHSGYAAPHAMCSKAFTLHVRRSLFRLESLLKLGAPASMIKSGKRSAGPGCARGSDEIRDKRIQLRADWLGHKRRTTEPIDVLSAFDYRACCLVCRSFAQWMRVCVSVSVCMVYALRCKIRFQNKNRIYQFRQKII